MHKFEVGEIPKASDLNKMVELLERLCNITVTEGSGLEMSESATGIVLNVTNPKIPRFAKVTSRIEPFNAQDSSLGSGKAKMLRGSREDELVEEEPNVVVDVYNDIVGSIEVGVQIKIIWMDGRWVVFNAGCGS
ncbi:hypothetical protein TA3x_004282 [Tundrisphaera sp. TA3]|uniref:hypothetical protein n=1 Tax=Tundrisphaera sp. TA3 TaxID=3435775 RepID=UPI003EB7F292